MSSLIERRDELTRMRTALKKFLLKNRKEHLINEINTLLRDKSFDEIDVFETLSLLQRVNVLLSTLIVKKQIVLTLKEINIKFNNLKKNTTKITSTLFIYASVTKTESTRSVDDVIASIVSYNNINDQRQLKKIFLKKKNNFWKSKNRKQKKICECCLSKNWWNICKELKKWKKTCWRRDVCQARTWKW
jgi:hypothetical protein